MPGIRLLVLLSLVHIAAAADDPLTIQPRELPRFPPVEPAAALSTFEIKRGFHLELVAAEPLVASPVAICFDEDGRLFALEMRDYPEQREEQPHLGRVRLLEDSDGDGRSDRATVFAEDLPWPTALFWANGGLFVCATPDIWWLQDTNADGRADVREIVYTGFDTGTPKRNVQGLPNCFAWGPDNRVHLQTSGSDRGTIRCLKRPELPAAELAGRDFWFDPRTLEFGFEAGGGQHGMSYDDGGRRFVCNNSDHLRTHLFSQRYSGRNPFCPLPSPLVSIAADGPAAPVFRISPDEPWRVIRTRWRVARKVPGVVEGGGRVSGYFTGATGTTVYRGDAYGPEFAGNTFTGDAGGNLVHRKRLRQEGASVVGERPDDERTSEFLASRDTWFRPVNFANAPDGTLYVIDMYREVIEHPWSIPEQIKQHLDLTSGRERGRIWRIAPDGFKAPSRPKLSAASTEELLAALGHGNGWWRDTATRLLCERRPPAAAALLERFLAGPASPPSRLHALRALDGLEALSAPALLRGLEDADEAVREHSLQLCEKLSRDGRAPEPLWPKLCALVDDPAPRVRLQLAFCLGEFANDGVADVLAALAQRDAQDPWIAAAIRSAPPSRMGQLFTRLSSDGIFAASVAGADFLAQLAAGIGARHDADEVQSVFAFASSEPPRLVIVGALAEGLARARSSLAIADRESRLPGLFASARKTLGAPAASDADRAAGARLLGFDAAPESRDALLGAVARGTPERLVRVVFDALGRASDEVTAAALLHRWNGFDARLRAETARFLLASPGRTRKLLAAIREGGIAPEDISPAQAAQLRQHRDPEIAATAAKLLPAPAVESRAAVISRLSSALQLAGTAAKGRVIFQQRCASCHRFRGEGYAFGPDLESVASGGKERLLTQMLDPNGEVAPQFAAYMAELKDGTMLAGVLANESADSIVVREPLGRETTIPRSRLLRLQTTGTSPMPDGLEAGLSPEDVADLLGFLTAPEPR